MKAAWHARNLEKYHKFEASHAMLPLGQSLYSVNGIDGAGLPEARKDTRSRASLYDRGMKLCPVGFEMARNGSADSFEERYHV